MSQAEFDNYATSYDSDLARSLAVTGENRDFYARARIKWTSQCVAKLRWPVRTILDYGCGTGTNSPILASEFRAHHVLGVDVSGLSIAQARQAGCGAEVSFLETKDWAPDGTVDLAFTNGVFHHIPPSMRQESLATIRHALCVGGLFAFWENNPWNLGTRYIMSQCAFDENAITITPREARGMLVKAGFSVLRTDSLFYFPRRLKLFRPLESWLRGLPFGGQYQVLCRNSLVDRS
jgi:SAM-dependent methyltransferase